MGCFQLGAALAKSLFPVIGAVGATAWRMGFSALLLAVLWRPWRIRTSARQARIIIAYGLTLACMNSVFYLSLQTIPLGVAVALEFTGPLAVALAASRRPLDYLWVVMAVLGLAALLPLGVGSHLAAIGVCYALAAGVCWALYILFGRRAGGAHGGQTTALGMLVGALVVVPAGLAHSGAGLFAPAILPTAIAVALLSSTLPYSLEMFALPRLPAHTYGILMSLDPPLAALSGLAFLGESLTRMQWAAVVCIMVASAGSAATHRTAARGAGGQGTG